MTRKLITGGSFIAVLILLSGSFKYIFERTFSGIKSAKFHRESFQTGPSSTTRTSFDRLVLADLDHCICNYIFSTVILMMNLKGSLKIHVHTWQSIDRTFSLFLNEPSHGQTSNFGFRPGPTQTGLYSHRSRLEA